METSQILLSCNLNNDSNNFIIILYYFAILNMYLYQTIMSLFISFKVFNSVTMFELLINKTC